MHSSLFNYNVTRPYPFPWFTPVAVIGGIVLIVLLSFMNFVQNSYALAVEYSGDPNITINTGIWFQNWPSYLTSSVRPVCEPANIPVNSQFFTNQTALTYTLTSVFNGSHHDSEASPSLTYYNNVLENCNITQLELSFDGSSSKSWAVYSQATWTIDVYAFATCGIWGPSGYTLFNLTAMFDPIVEVGSVPGSTSFVSRSTMNRASLYWAEALLSANWVDVVTRLYSRTSSYLQLQKGAVWMKQSKNVSDIDSLEFFDMRYNFYTNNASLGSVYIWDNSSTVAYFVSQGKDRPPQVWLEVDRLAKSMYTAVLADLGQTNSSRGPSLVNNQTRLQHYTSNFSSITERSAIYRPFYTPLESEDYDTRKREGKTGPLKFSPSVISTKYLCQVPKLKTGGDIFISVLLADLVLLSAAWHLYTFGVEWLLLHRRPSTNYCQGCLSKQDDEYRLLDTKRLSEPSEYIGAARSSTYQALGSELTGTRRFSQDQDQPLEFEREQTERSFIK